MASQCQFCAALFISRLIGLVEQEFRGRVKHHKSLQNPKALAAAGCSLCMLILECFKSKAGSLIYSAVKNGPGTYIGVYIDSGHEVLRDVPVFDTLSIHPAIRDPWHFRINPLHLMLTTPRDEKVVVRNHRIKQFQLDPDLRSRSNHDLARTWLRDCEQTHVNCLRHDACEIPTRVIDVETDRDSQTIRIVHSRGKVARYVTLSHCRGGDVSHILITKTLERY
ncbi:hypothetical protein GGR53DRAFT_509871 [Hypoxylon sp. FL1150]|nr:hypothetical protein GGR53DRAFT_509871 [Hypoxylon sp. FL1150]